MITISPPQYLQKPGFIVPAFSQNYAL